MLAIACPLFIIANFANECTAAIGTAEACDSFDDQPLADEQPLTANALTDSIVHEAKVHCRNLTAT